MDLAALMPAPYRILAGVVILLVLLAAAAGVAGWQVAGHYRPLLDAAQAQLATCRAARGNLEGLVGEQGQQLRTLLLQGEQRQRQAAQALTAAREEARADFAAANRLQRERIGGDPCVAATAVIDQELGL